MLENAHSFQMVAATESSPKWDSMVSRAAPLYGRENDVRSEFGRDYTRILHSTAYRRLKHKTQVFFSPQNDHICTRIEHVNHVESVSFSIANFLGLNTELTKAIAVGHDLGHAPFGHLGEEIIKKILRENGFADFWHEKNGLHFVDNLELLDDDEGYKTNLNLTYAVRDGIIAHCGEVDQNGIKPRDEFLDLGDYQAANQYAPYTWEGCIVKIADKISYLGRDIEDAITLGILEKSQISELMNSLRCVGKFGKLNIKELNNTALMHEFIINLCQCSTPEKGICLSDEYFELMKQVKDFNYQYIYRHKRLETYEEYASMVINKIFNILLETYDGAGTPHKLEKLSTYYPTLASEFLGWVNKYWDITDRSKPNNKLKNWVVYQISNDKKAYMLAIIDFISGMTDHFAIKIFNEIISF